jgi:hypothetical protein
MLEYTFNGAIIYFQVAPPTLSRLLDSPDWNALERDFTAAIHGVLRRCIGER